MYGTKGGTPGEVTSWASSVAFPNFRSAQRIWFKTESKEEEEAEKEGGGRQRKEKEGVEGR